MNLTCVVKHSPEPPPAIFWTHNSKVSLFFSSLLLLLSFFKNEAPDIQPFYPIEGKVGRVKMIQKRGVYERHVNFYRKWRKKK